MVKAETGRDCRWGKLQTVSRVSIHEPNGILFTPPGRIVGWAAFKRTWQYLASSIIEGFRTFFQDKSDFASTVLAKRKRNVACFEDVSC